MSRRAAWRAAVGGLALLLATGSALAASFLDFDRWMQQIDHHSQTVLHHLQRSDAPAALADARELERLYREMERFYEQRGELDDPLLLSWDGRERAAAVQRQVGAGDFDAAFASALGIARDCRACHDRFKPLKPLG